MRLFAAIDPPAEAVTDLELAIGDADGRLRWVPSTQWHVTTAFYGEVGEAIADALGQRLGRAAQRTPPLSLRFAGAGSFPRRSTAARVLWVGLSGDMEQLTRLTERCGAAGRHSGLTIEDRRFHAHLTLARVRRNAVDLSAQVAALSSYVGPSWPVTSLRLVRSTLGPDVRHETLDEWSLGANRGNPQVAP
jgi:2'-5' RNA ligase